MTAVSSADMAFGDQWIQLLLGICGEVGSPMQGWVGVAPASWDFGAGRFMYQPCALRPHSLQARPIALLAFAWLHAIWSSPRLWSSWLQVCQEQQPELLALLAQLQGQPLLLEPLATPACGQR